jgi:hypothetical protein
MITRSGAPLFAWAGHSPLKHINEITARIDPNIIKVKNEPILFMEHLLSDYGVEK